MRGTVFSLVKKGSSIQHKTVGFTTNQPLAQKCESDLTKYLFSESNFSIFPHCDSIFIFHFTWIFLRKKGADSLVTLISRVFLTKKIIGRYKAQCREWKLYSHRNNISSNQLFSKNVTFPKVLKKMCVRVNCRNFRSPH